MYYLLEILDYEKNKFEVDYFIDTRGLIKLEEYISFLHKLEIEKTIENIKDLDFCVTKVNETLYSIIGLFEEYLKIEIMRSLDLKNINLLRSFTLKSLLEIVILNNLNFINLKEEEILLMVNLRKNVYLHRITIDLKNKIAIKKLYDLLPLYLSNIFIKKMIDINKRYEKFALLEGLLNEEQKRKN